jgi:hypothetical protein
VLVSLGLGSVIASAFAAAPWLTLIGRYKNGIFAAVGVLLVLNYWIAIVRPGRRACLPGEACHVDAPAMRASRWLYWASVVTYVVAVAFTFGAEWWLEHQP